MPSGKIVITGYDSNNENAPIYGVSYGPIGLLKLPVDASDVLSCGLNGGDPVEFITDKETGYAILNSPRADDPGRRK